MTNDPAALQDLMAQAGPVLDLARVTAYEGEHAWSLVFDDEYGSSIDAEWDSAAERLVLTASVATVPESARLRAYELLLQYNYLWNEHGGVRAALADPAGDVALLFDLPLTGLDLPRLCEVLTNLHAVAGGCRSVLGAAAEAASAARVPASGIHAAPGQGQGSAALPPMIRV